MVSLIGFNGERLFSIGEINLSVKAGRVKLVTPFLVIDAPTSYNVIMGPTLDLYHEGYPLHVPQSNKVLDTLEHKKSGANKKKSRAVVSPSKSI